MEDELKERRMRGLEVRIGNLAVQLDEVRSQIREVERGNAEIIAQQRRSRFHLVEGRAFAPPPTSWN